MKKSPVYYADHFTAQRLVTLYVVLWVFLVAAAGVFSNWIFHLVYPELASDGGDSWIGFANSAMFSTIYVLLFHFTFTGAIKRFPPSIPANGFIHAGLGLMNVFLTLILGIILMPMLLDSMGHPPHAQKLELDVAIITLIILCCALVFSGIFYFEWFIKERSKADQARVKSELSALRAQINPHFLFNAMNTIAALVRKDPNLAEEVVLDLADVFRYILASSKKASVSLAEELQLVRMYLNIEKARFNNRLQVEISVEPGLDQVHIPSLLLQPLVENAIKHSVSKVTGPHEVHINCKKNDHGMSIKIKDSGPGFQSRELQQFLHVGTGLTNVKRLLDLSFPDANSLEIVDGGILLHLNMKMELH